METDDQVLNGTEGPDTLTGGAGDDSLSGGAGEDTLIGGAGDDTLAGGGGDDTLTGGGGGDDTLTGGGGDDVLSGGPGTDTARFAGADTGVTANLDSGTATGAGLDILSGIENLTGSAFDDTLTGDAGANVLDGGEGDDTLAGGGGADTLIGGSGRDTADFSDLDTAVTLDLPEGTADADATSLVAGVENAIGTAFDDTLTGDGADNRLTGRAGDDLIVGGGGADTLIGGTGDDVLRAGAGDRVVAGVGDDVLDLSNGVSGDLTWVDPTANDRIRLPEALEPAQVQVTTVTPEGAAEAHAELRLDLDGDGSFADEAAITLSRRADIAFRPGLDDAADDAPTLFIEGPEMNLPALSAPDQLSLLYVGYFERVPDPTGLAFWEGEVTRGLDDGKSEPQVLRDIAESFRLGAEAQNLFPRIAPENAETNEANEENEAGGIDAFVSEVHQNLFNRAPDAATLEMWSGVVAERLAASIQVGDVVVEIAARAEDGDAADATTLRNKIEQAQQTATDLAAADVTLGADVTLDDLRGGLGGVSGAYADFTDAREAVQSLIPAADGADALL